jgi:hypothetical protein
MTRIFMTADCRSLGFYTRFDGLHSRKAATGVTDTRKLQR